ncbi:hypothetical protein EHS13_12605 [Paenibacillus psychroresistens]|uniref:GIY-YIG nuclease family protein n=1 Tax=Paenibacillus psychroresistens TaxID=1778678 RepID=A0A6B8RIU4_9BACL|nr:hypothetical protein [Paenibacillus psychroresistens]QGQ95664.1 hypothetical protein EHS13_12605 [Paenibacillus psychroresistens]
MNNKTSDITHDFSDPIPLQVLSVDKAYDLIPKEKGVYIILRDSSEPVVFLEESVGGHFKNQDPTVSIKVLSKKWIPDTEILYIGQCGSGISKGTLRSRIKQYMDFGNGKPVGHWGGRYIWQISDHKDLFIVFKAVPDDEDPREVEQELIYRFMKVYGDLPFANTNK